MEKRVVGKTTLAGHVVAEAQKLGDTCVYIDVENAIDLDYFSNLGVKIKGENFLLSQPDNGEQALDIVEMLLKSETVGVIVVDSVAALIPKAELEGEMGDSTIGLQARMMSKAMRRITQFVRKSNACLIFINQLRSNISKFGYGPTTVTTGGKSLPYYASIRIELSKMEAIKNGEEIIGTKVKANIRKNKVASPFRVATYDIIYGQGINEDRLFIFNAIKNGIIEKSGSWFKYKGESIGQGLEKVKVFLSENPDVRKEIENY